MLEHRRARRRKRVYEIKRIIEEFYECAEVMKDDEFEYQRKKLRSSNKNQITKDKVGNHGNENL